MQKLSIGIDIGGTFTDFVVFNKTTGLISSFKLPSTPKEPDQAVVTGISTVYKTINPNPNNPTAEITLIIHGTTVATNILLERKAEPVALITTAGFSDIIQIGRQNRSSLYDFFLQNPHPLVPSNLRFEVTERIDHNGNVQIPLAAGEVKRVVQEIKNTGVSSVAVCLLFSFLHQNHEQLLGDHLRKAGFQVSLSSEINPVYREYERMSTTTINAYVSPSMDDYLSRLEKKVREILIRENNDFGNLHPPKFWIMQSNGGSISIANARHEGVRCVLSGPAGGVIGATRVSNLATHRKNLRSEVDKEHHLANWGKYKILTFDMGGTSTDVSIISGLQELTTESIISGCPINLPMLDIHTIGAGGGSIADIDAGGALRVGPASAGADPGPACYGTGNFATVTDANLLLGRIPTDNFLGGMISLDYSHAYSVIQTLGNSLGLSAEKTALGILAVANAHMERALRAISIERGHDPRNLLLLSFGGAGGLHACSLAKSLGINFILIPPMASTLSAYGMLVADVIKDYSQTVMFSSSTPHDEIRRSMSVLEKQGFEAILSEGFPSNKIKIERRLEMRYQGQSYELSVPYGKDFINSFHKLHSKHYGYAKVGSLIEIVSLHVRAIGKNNPPPLRTFDVVDPCPDNAFINNSQVYFGTEITNTPLFNGELLKSGNIISGPAIIIRSDTTLLLPPGTRATVDKYKNLFVKVEK